MESVSKEKRKVKGHRLEVKRQHIVFLAYVDTLSSPFAPPPKLRLHFYYQFKSGEHDFQNN